MAIETNPLHSLLPSSLKASTVLRKRQVQGQQVVTTVKPVVQPVSVEVVKKKKGRPKKAIEEIAPKQETKPASLHKGRPKGAKNKPKKLVDELMLDLPPVISQIANTPLAAAIDYIAANMGDKDRTFWTHEMDRRNMSMRQVLARYFLSQFQLIRIDISNYK